MVISQELERSVTCSGKILCDYGSNLYIHIHIHTATLSLSAVSISFCHKNLVKGVNKTEYHHTSLLCKCNLSLYFSSSSVSESLDTDSVGDEWPCSTNMIKLCTTRVKSCVVKNLNPIDIQNAYKVKYESGAGTGDYLH